MEGRSPGTVLVTGASRGVGRAVARRLARDGHRIYLGGRDLVRLDAAAAESGGEALPFDITDPDEVDGAFQRLMDEGVTLDVLVNAAGVFDLAPLSRTTHEVFDRNLDVNLRGAFHVIRVCLPGMLERGSGLIVNVGSVSGRKAFPENGAYAASKFGLRGLHEVLLEEIRGTGVRASLLEPGATDTPVWDPIDPDAVPHLPDRSQMLEPEDVARAVSFVVGLPGHVSIPLLQIERA